VDAADDHLIVDTFYSDKMCTIGNALGVNKQSVIDTKGSHLRCHILPAFGEMKLDAITGTKIEDFKIALAKAKLAPTTINCRIPSADSRIALLPIVALAIVAWHRGVRKRS
jgi:hypothetical protein